MIRDRCLWELLGKGQAGLGALLLCLTAPRPGSCRPWHRTQHQTLPAPSLERDQVWFSHSAPSVGAVPDGWTGALCPVILPWRALCSHS